MLWDPQVLPRGLGAASAPLTGDPPPGRDNPRRGSRRAFVLVPRSVFWMDGWVDGWMGGWMSGWMGEWMGSRDDGWVEGWMDDGWVGGCVDG